MTLHPGGSQRHKNQPSQYRSLRQEGDWAKLNAGQLGAFRVSYSPELWARLAAAAAVTPKHAGAPGLAPADVAGLLDDAWALAEAGIAPISAFLNLTRCAHQEALIKNPVHRAQFGARPGWITHVRWQNSWRCAKSCLA